MMRAWPELRPRARGARLLMCGLLKTNNRRLEPPPARHRPPDIRSLMLRELAFEKLTSVKGFEMRQWALTSAESCCAFSIHLCLAQARARCRPDATRPSRTTLAEEPRDNVRGNSRGAASAPPLQGR